MLGVGQVIFTFVFVNDGKFFTLVDIHFQVSAYEKHRLKIIACVTGSLQVLKCVQCYWFFTSIEVCYWACV